MKFLNYKRNAESLQLVSGVSRILKQSPTNITKRTIKWRDNGITYKNDILYVRCKLSAKRQRKLKAVTDRLNVEFAYAPKELATAGQTLDTSSTLAEQTTENPMNRFCSEEAVDKYDWKKTFLNVLIQEGCSASLAQQIVKTIAKIYCYYDGAEAYCVEDAKVLASKIEELNLNFALLDAMASIETLNKFIAIEYAAKIEIKRNMLLAHFMTKHSYSKELAEHCIKMMADRSSIGTVVRAQVDFYAEELAQHVIKTTTN